MIRIVLINKNHYKTPQKEKIMGILKKLDKQPETPASSHLWVWLQTAQDIDKTHKNEKQINNRLDDKNLYMDAHATSMTYGM